MSKVLKATIGLMLITMVSKILGFSRELVLGAVYGVSTISDVYITAMNIPTVLFTSVGVALATTFIPLYYENLELGGKEKATKFTNNIINIVLIISIIMSLLCFLFADQIVKIFAIGFKGNTLSMAVKFTKIMIFSGIFIGINHIMTSLLQVKGKYVIPGFIGIPYNIIIICSIIFSDDKYIYILPIGTLVAILSQFVFQYFFVKKDGFKYHFVFDLKDEYVKKMVLLILPVFIGVAVNQINALIDRTIASTLVEGSISALNYANRLNSFVIGLFISTLSAVIYPTLAKISFNDKEKFISSISTSVNWVIILIVPIAIGAIVLSEPIVRILFQRGAFDTIATKMTSTALLFYSIGMIGFAIREILNKVFYSLQDTKTPMINGIIAVVLNIILNIILSKIMGYAGLALATSISAIVCILLLFKSLENKIGYFRQDKIKIVFLKSLISGIIMGVITKISFYYLVKITSSELLSLIVSIIIGMLIYGILGIVMKNEEISLLIIKIKEKLRIRKFKIE